MHKKLILDTNKGQLYHENNILKQLQMLNEDNNMTQDQLGSY